MSLQAMVKAIKSKGLSPTEKLVLICLANYANENDEAWPRQSTIADECGLSRETVLRTYKALEAKGIISSERRTNEHGTDIAKKVKMFPDSVTQDHTSVTEDHTQCDAGSQGSVTQDHTYKDKPINTNRVREPIDNPRVPALMVIQGEIVSEFDDFWKAYPKKVSKADAVRAFDKAVRKTSPPEIMAGLERAVRSDQRFKTRQYTPNPATWLNDEGWNDEHPTNDLHPAASQGRPVAPFFAAIEARAQRRGA